MNLWKCNFSKATWNPREYSRKLKEKKSKSFEKHFSKMENSMCFGKSFSRVVFHVSFWKTIFNGKYYDCLKNKISVKTPWFLGKQFLDVNSLVSSKRKILDANLKVVWKTIFHGL